MRFYNARVLGERGFYTGGFTVENGRFAELYPDGEVPLDAGRGEGVDLQGQTVLPGLVDLHIHGSAGADFSDGDAAGLETMARYLAAHGVTSFVPTAMTLPDAALSAALQTAVRARERENAHSAACGYSGKSSARILGVRMEGPFLSREKKGSQNGAYLRLPDAAACESFEALRRESGGLLCMVDVAPELPGALAFIRRAKEHGTVSVAHTAAGYAEAAAAFDAGASHLTHLYNAMPPLLHRAPGPIAAASERENVTAEVICDGCHVHPAAIRAAFRLFPGRLCLVSDALRCAGMPEGEYELSGQRVFLRDGAARLADGTLAGSAVNLFTCLQNAICFGIPVEEAVRAASWLPVRVAGQAETVGSIAPGKLADFLVCGGDWELRGVYMGGKVIK